MLPEKNESNKFHRVAYRFFKSYLTIYSLCIDAHPNQDKDNWLILAVIYLTLKHFPQTSAAAEEHLRAFTQGWVQRHNHHYNQ